MPTNNEIVATVTTNKEVEATLYPPQGIRAEYDKLYLYNPDAAMQEVIHDETLEGKGLEDSPLKLSAELLAEIHRGGNTFVFEFDASQSEWIIEHNLNKKPSITVVDSADTVMTCAKEFVDMNNVKITFNAPFKGTAYLN